MALIRSYVGQHSAAFFGSHAPTGAGYGPNSFQSLNPGKTNTLSEITCPLASECWAVGGWFNSSSVNTPLLEKWNGSAWKVS